MAQLRMTLTTQAVLRAFLDNPAVARYGLEVGALTGLPSGTVHPILARLENCRWLESSWEDIDPAQEGRPRRRFYRLSDEGLVAGRHALAEVSAARTRLTSRLRPIGESG